MIDPSAVRAHFPALDPRSHGGAAPLYFDNPGGTQIAREAMDGITEYLVQRNANHDGSFRASRESDAMVAETRAAAADFLGASRPEEICFGQNMTSLTLHLSRSIARGARPGDEIVVTRLDHDANISPWILAARDRGALVRWVDFDPRDCAWSIEALAAQVSSRTKVVAVGLASNSTGTINPVAEAARIAHEAGALCFVDAVHYAPHGPIDAAALGCDFLACSAYKFFGPHVGILWGRYELLDRLSAYKVRPAGDAPPHKWETGTQSFEGIAGVRGCLAYLEWLGRTYGGAQSASSGTGRASRKAALRAAMACIGEYEMGLQRMMRDGLSSVKGLCIRGIVGGGAGGGAACRRSPSPCRDAIRRRSARRWTPPASPRGTATTTRVEVTRRLGLDEAGGMVRVGAVHYNTRAEVERLVDAAAAIAGSRVSGVASEARRVSGADPRVRWDAEAYARNSTAQQQWALELIAMLDLNGHGVRAGHRVRGRQGHRRDRAACPARTGRRAGQLGGHDPRWRARPFRRPSWPNLRFQERDARALEFHEEREFDVVFSNATLHWVKDHRPVLRGVARSLRRGGRVLFQMGGRGNGEEIFEVAAAMAHRAAAWERWFPASSFPGGFYGPEEYRAWCAEAGLSRAASSFCPAR